MQHQNDTFESLMRDPSLGRQDGESMLNLIPFPENKASIQKEIRFNMAYCQSNRLSQTSKWLGELLVTLQMDNAKFKHLSKQSMDDQAMSEGSVLQNETFSDVIEENDLPACAVYNGQFNKVFFERPNETMDKLNLCRTLFDLKEYRKCTYQLNTIAGPSNQSALFLKNFSTYLVNEQKQEEQNLEKGDKIQAQSQIGAYSSNSNSNKEIVAIEQNLRGLRDAKQLNAINLYMLGVILKQKNSKDEARDVLIEALNKMPLLWSAWLELASLVDQKDARSQVFNKIQDHWVKNFYYACFFLDKMQAKDSIDMSCQLFKTFKGSVFIMNQIAHASYISLEYEFAIDWFQRLLRKDPFRYENLDLYSNILYIKENYGELANLAFSAFQNDKYRPESCCVVGNYYSLRGDHQKSALYFMRAIKLDKKFISAWTLMGHEYLEMKNTSAAIESYRTAVDTDPTDFRAWYGLGQAYEINQMYSYATHYYATAALAKPSDARMWNAMSNCYEKMDKNIEAKKCSERAERFKDKEGIALHKLAKLYITMDELERAATCFELNLKRKGIQDNTETSDALMFLVKFSKSKGRFDEALHYAKSLGDRFCTAREEAGAMIREINKEQNKRR